MREQELDSSVNEYIEEYKSSNYVKQQQWDMAIGLQEVDNLKPSKYLEKLVSDNIDGNLTIEEVLNELNSYLIKFYENLLLGKNNNLLSSDLIVKELF